MKVRREDSKKIELYRGGLLFNAAYSTRIDDIDAVQVMRLYNL